MVKQKIKMSNNPELELIAMEIQNECHQTAENIIDNSELSVTVQDATNVFFYRKLAEMELRLRAIEQKPKGSDRSGIYGPNKR